jgi:hypothetical protein
MQLYTQSQIGSRVARIVRVAGKVDAELHVVLCSILSHTQEHGDYTALLPLLNGLPNGVRKQAIVAWVSHFTNKKLVARLDTKSKAWVAELAKDRTSEDFDIIGAMAVTFGDFTKEPEPTTLTIALLVKMLEKKATDSQTNKDGSPKVSPEARALASNVVAAIRAGKIVTTNSAEAA